MTENKIKILIVFLAFNLIFNEPIEITNFEEITYPIGISDYSYEFSEFNSPEGENAFFYFNFTNKENLQLKIIDANNQNYTINIKSTDKTWINYNITNLSQKYIFEIINNGESPGQMIFIDSTKEISTNLEKFINLNLSTGEISKNIPLPLIFKIDIQDNIILNFKETQTSPYYYDEEKYILKYCLINENECNFKGFKGLNFEKGKKYKIKLNFYKNYAGNIYYFTKIEFKLYYLNELNSCSVNYKTNGK